jgi:threonine dehydratase
MTPTLSDIRKAAERIHPYAHRTPVLTNESLNQQVGAQVFLKCENLQKVGAFKFRGACNAVFSLTDEEAKHGVCTHSSGNHAAALALAARMRRIPAYIVMPNNAPDVKKAAVAGYGGIITFCEPTLEARESTLEKVKQETGANVVHPYNDERVITGQGTAALELLEEYPNLDVVIAPVGGGGLLSGTSIAATELKKGIRVIAAEPELADDAFRSIKAGEIIPSQNPKTTNCYCKRICYYPIDEIYLGAREDHHRTIICCSNWRTLGKEDRSEWTESWRYHQLRQRGPGKTYMAIVSATLHDSRKTY